MTSILKPNLRCGALAPVAAALAASALPVGLHAQGQCPYGVDQCKPGYVWRDAYGGDHVCVTGAERARVAADNGLDSSRRLPNGYCVFGYVWRDATPSDHVCVTGSTRADTARQNRDAPANVDPACRPESPPELRTEYLRKPAAPAAPRPSYAYSVLSPDGSLRGVSMGPLAGTTDLMWAPGSTIKVSIAGASTALNARIQRYATEWVKWANVRFKFVDDPASAQVRVQVDGDGTSWSFVGRDALNHPAPETTVNLGWLTDMTSDEEVSRVVEHEFGHVLGMIHEHQSPAAGIPWDVPKVLAYYRENDGWSDATIQANVFDQASADTTNFSAFDPTSIMEYPIDPALTTNGYSVGWNTTLSPTDKLWISRFYPYPPGSRGTVFTGDDCDTIGFDLANGVPGQDGVRFILRLGQGVNWWKSIAVPTQGGGQVEIQAQDDLSGDTVLSVDNVDSSRPIRFAKAKGFGVHTWLGFTWNALPAMAGGSRLILDWNRDSCR